MFSEPGRESSHHQEKNPFQLQPAVVPSRTNILDTAVFDGSNEQTTAHGRPVSPFAKNDHTFLGSLKLYGEFRGEIQDVVKGALSLQQISDKAQWLIEHALPAAKAVNDLRNDLVGRELNAEMHEQKLIVAVARSTREDLQLSQSLADLAKRVVVGGTTVVATLPVIIGVSYFLPPTLSFATSVVGLGVFTGALPYTFATVHYLESCLRRKMDYHFKLKKHSPQAALKEVATRWPENEPDNSNRGSTLWPYLKSIRSEIPAMARIVRLTFKGNASTSDKADI